MLPGKRCRPPRKQGHTPGKQGRRRRQDGRASWEARARFQGSVLSGSSEAWPCFMETRSRFVGSMPTLRGEHGRASRQDGHTSQEAWPRFPGNMVRAPRTRTRVLATHLPLPAARLALAPESTLASARSRGRRRSTTSSEPPKRKPRPLRLHLCAHCSRARTSRNGSSITRRARSARTTASRSPKLRSDPTPRGALVTASAGAPIEAPKRPAGPVADCETHEGPVEHPGVRDVRPAHAASEETTPPLNAAAAAPVRAVGPVTESCVQVEPFQVHVSLRSVPPLPPKSTT